MIGLSAVLDAGKDQVGDVAAIILVVPGILLLLWAGVSIFNALDRQSNSFHDRRRRSLRDRPRRCREHKPRRGWVELNNYHPQYGVEVRPSGSDMEFTVLRYDAPRGRLQRLFTPWPCQQQRWDSSLQRWAVEGHTLRVTDPQTDLLLEAYCEASEAAKAMEKEAYNQAAKKVALQGMALAFMPPSSKTTNEKHLEDIRQRVQSRRLLDSGD